VGDAATIAKKSKGVRQQRATPAVPCLVLSDKSGGRAPHAVMSIALTGAWTIVASRTIEDMLASGTKGVSAGANIELDLSRLDSIDTAGAYLIERHIERWRLAGIAVAMFGASPSAQLLLATVRPQAALAQQPHRSASPPGILADVVRSVGSIGADTIALTGFLGQVVTALVLTILKPWRFRSTAFIHHLEHAGLRALPIVALVCLLIGAVVMQQGAVQLRPFGAELFSVNMLAILSLREVGVLLTAVMVAGRSGSAYTAEIGAMKMREEIDAMRTLGLDPMETLVLPRLLALIVVLPILTFIGSMMCLAGGGIAAVLTLGLDWQTYAERLRDAVSLNHLFVGLIKTPVIAIIIGMVGCIEGLKVRGSAESLGARVTSAVVKAIFLVLVVDGLFAIGLASIGF
jgi:phospholipid/cholesterol/gamma-HCH transport system permease protein